MKKLNSFWIVFFSFGMIPLCLVAYAFYLDSKATNARFDSCYKEGGIMVTRHHGFSSDTYTCLEKGKH